MELLKFTARWCSPCRLMQRTVAKWVEAHPDLTLREVDVDSRDAPIEALVRRHQVMTIPKLVLTDDAGRSLATVSGLADTPELDRMLERARVKLIEEAAVRAVGATGEAPTKPPPKRRKRPAA